MMIYRAWIFLALVAYATVGSATASDVMAARTLPIGSIVELSDLELADEAEPSAADTTGTSHSSFSTPGVTGFVGM